MVCVTRHQSSESSSSICFQCATFCPDVLLCQPEKPPAARYGRPRGRVAVIAKPVSRLLPARLPVNLFDWKADHPGHPPAPRLTPGRMPTENSALLRKGESGKLSGEIPF